jgi:hypothetical protein
VRLLGAEIQKEGKLTMSMQKLSSEKTAEVLRQVGPALRALSEENTALKEKLAFHEKRERVEKLATVMDVKNLEPELTHEEKVERLMGQNNLDVVEQAVDMSAQQVKLASISDYPGDGHDAKTAFEAAIVE